MSNKSNSYGLLISNNFEIQKGKLYSIRFTISADSTFTITPTIRRSSGDWASLGFSKILKVKSDTFEFYFEALDSASKARLDFSASSSSPLIYFDNISLKETTEPAVDVVSNAGYKTTKAQLPSNAVDELGLPISKLLKPLEAQVYVIPAGNTDSTSNSKKQKNKFY
jgi:hypothetical protein